MTSRSTMSAAARAGLVLVGALAILAGWFVQVLDEDTCSLDYVGVYPSDGTAILFDAAVIPPGTFVDSAPGGGFLHARGGEGEPQILFEGTQDEAAVWVASQGWAAAFRGPEAEASAWVDDQCAAEDGVVVPYLLFSAGGVLVLLGLGLGWSRRPDEGG